MRLLIIVIFSLSALVVKSQDRILLMNGKQFYGVSLDTSGVKIQFNIEKKQDKYKLKSVYRDEVFSIHFPDSLEKVFFYPDMYFVDEYGIDNMRMVVMGRKDARYQFKTKWVIPLGLGVSAVSAYFMKGSVYTLFIPILYTGLIQIPVVKIQKESISSPNFIGNEFYAEGYDKSARSKRTKHALFSSILGTAVGLLIYGATK
jgi:hypothetical protein